ncbi:MAG: 2-oxo acid dehydrogenase subunit E2 [Deltaproteobacteria bacterium]|nr:2-oxo acid dehydrogenase subunit E2 [Deltaproteobacteria bacterium]
MAKIIGLPKLSPTMEEGTLVRWTKQEGDAVEVDELLAEVETDKATMEFRSFDRGVLLKILIAEGESAPPDAPVAIIGEAGEDISDLLAQLASSASVSEVAPASPERQTAVALPSPEPATPASLPFAPQPTGRILASPLVRRLAREQGVELSDLRGTGPRGRIIKRDLEGYTPAVAPVISAGRLPARVERASATRRTIARRLTESTQGVPHYYLTIDIDAEPLVDARRRINAELTQQGEKVSLNDLILKACAVALRRVPEVNVSWVDGDIHLHQVVDISVAVAIPDGLVTPVVRDADKLGVLAISQQVRELAGRARDKRLSLEEMTNGTFSISNLGMFGIESFTAVINPPEGAILAVGALREEPVVKGDVLAPGKRMRMTLSCDHRVIDGALGARFCAALKRLLESPANMLI